MASVLAFPLTATQLMASPTVETEFTLQNKKRVSRTEFDYFYKAKIKTDNTAIQSATATLTSTSDKTKVIDGELSFGATLANSVSESTDTFTIRQTRSVKFDPTVLNWSVSFVSTETSDETAPVLEAKTPANGATITDITQALVFTLSDADSGVETSSIEVKVNGVDRTSLTKYENDELTLTPDVANYWQAGVMTITIKAADTETNTTTKSFSFNVQPGTAALPKASPSSGFAPLTVRLTPFNTASNAIVSYEWDFDSDGTYDVRETVGVNQTRTFNTPGAHIVTLKITDASGKETTGTVNIEVNNKPPVVNASASPSNGGAPLTVNFSANAQDSDGIALYEWDFEGDGTVDVSDVSASTATHTYSSQGKFQPVLKVKDNLGAETSYAFDDIEVQVNPPNYPTVTLSASPQSGNAPLDVNFAANATPVGTRTLSKWEWDFDGDGTYDETTTTDTASHKYTKAGSFYSRVRVTDSDNQSTEDVVKVTVNTSVNLSVSTDTIDIGAGEKVTINTVLNADSVVSVVIEDSFGNTVKTLVPKGERKAGSHDDEWDGNDDAGNLVTEGEYRAVLVYELDGAEQRFDLSTTTGGRSSVPSQPNRIPSSFQPFANNPLRISFTLDRASEVTVFMGKFISGRADERFITFMQRKPMGKGTYHVLWNGEDSEGKIIQLSAGESFIPGAFVYTFPDNGIYVRSGAHISNLVRTPSLFVPDSVDNPMTTLSFDLSNTAAVKLVIHNADTGQPVAVFNNPGLVAGNNEITWDGRNNQGIFVKPGKYRLGVVAIDANGYQSITQYAVQQVYY